MGAFVQRQVTEHTGRLSGNAALLFRVTCAMYLCFLCWLELFWRGTRGPLTHSSPRTNDGGKHRTDADNSEPKFVYLQLRALMRRFPLTATRK
ncbi:hypothetical protein BaRGS_00035422 [Batillaria attramentaria]|uniref:Secreted protein n=1 Tax=Batillaria attramentaria TaxID=370345 RepID=A0ABD0JEJ4_9CAEN